MYFIGGKITMKKYAKMKDFLSTRDVINNQVSIKDIEKYLGKKLPKSYYNKGYWNNKKCAIGEILNDMGLKVKSVETFITFEKK